MGKYIKLFNTVLEYQAYASDISKFILPNVSLCEDENKLYINPFTGSKILCKYNVTNTSSPTALRTNYESNVFKSMEIDGVMLDELVTEYTFDTTGVHTVKYELYDETQLGNRAPVFSSSNLIECIIPDSVTSIGSNAFNNCSGLTSIDIPDSVTNIGDATFSSCTGLTSIVIPDSVTNIGNGAFSSCTGLTSIVIPDSVTSIGIGAFYSCTGLTSIVSNTMTAPTIANTTFLNVKTSGTLTVPTGSTGYDIWMGTGDYYLGKYGWTKVDQ